MAASDDRALQQPTFCCVPETTVVPAVDQKVFQTTARFRSSAIEQFPVLGEDHSIPVGVTKSMVADDPAKGLDGF